MSEKKERNQSIFVSVFIIYLSTYKCFVCWIRLLKPGDGAGAYVPAAQVVHFVAPENTRAFNNAAQRKNHAFVPVIFLSNMQMTRLQCRNVIKGRAHCNLEQNKFPGGKGRKKRHLHILTRKVTIRCVTNVLWCVMFGLIKSTRFNGSHFWEVRPYSRIRFKNFPILALGIINDWSHGVAMNFTDTVHQIEFEN